MRKIIVLLFLIGLFVNKAFAGPLLPTLGDGGGGGGGASDSVKSDGNPIDVAQDSKKTQKSSGRKIPSSDYSRLLSQSYNSIDANDFANNINSVATYQRIAINLADPGVGAGAAQASVEMSNKVSILAQGRDQFLNNLLPLYGSQRDIVYNFYMECESALLNQGTKNMYDIQRVCLSKINEQFNVEDNATSPGNDDRIKLEQAVKEGWGKFFNSINKDLKCNITEDPPAADSLDTNCGITDKEGIRASTILASLQSNAVDPKSAMKKFQEFYGDRCLFYDNEGGKKCDYIIDPEKKTKNQFVGRIKENLVVSFIDNADKDYADNTGLKVCTDSMPNRSNYVCLSDLHKDLFLDYHESVYRYLRPLMLLKCKKDSGDGANNRVNHSIQDLFPQTQFIDGEMRVKNAGNFWISDWVNRSWLRKLSFGVWSFTPQAGDTIYNAITQNMGIKNAENFSKSWEQCDKQFEKIKEFYSDALIAQIQSTSSFINSSDDLLGDTSQKNGNSSNSNILLYSSQAIARGQYLEAAINYIRLAHSVPKEIPIKVDAKGLVEQVFPMPREALVDVVLHRVINESSNLFLEKCALYDPDDGKACRVKLIDQLVNAYESNTRSFNALLQEIRDAQLSKAADSGQILRQVVEKRAEQKSGQIDLPF